MRLPRPQIRDCCVHVTHRCQQREFLLTFAIDRQQYQRRLLQASRKFWRLRFLDYAITSNHIHLLLWVPRMSDLSEMWIIRSPGLTAGHKNCAGHVNGTGSATTLGSCGASGCLSRSRSSTAGTGRRLTTFSASGPPRPS